jgi:hypothetical protein
MSERSKLSSVSTPMLRNMAIGSFALGALMVVVAEFPPLKVAFLLICGIGGLALLKMGGRICGDDDGLEIQRLWSRKRIRWQDIVAVTYSRGGNSVFSARDGGRMVIPSSGFWSGPQKLDLVELIDDKLATRMSSLASRGKPPGSPTSSTSTA